MESECCKKIPIDFHFVDRLLEEIGREPEALIPLLQAIQSHYNYLPDEVLRYVCLHSTITPASIESVSSFFGQFRRQPIGKHIINVCDGTACHVKGSERVYDSVADYLGLKVGEDTDTQREFTVRKVACLGCCTLAPAVQIGTTTYGHVRPDIVGQMLDDYLNQQEHRKSEEVFAFDHLPIVEGEIRIGLGSCCVAGGSEKIRRALMESLYKMGIYVHVKQVSCVGMCYQTPLLEIHVPKTSPQLYVKVKPEEIADILSRHFKSKSYWATLRRITEQKLKQLYLQQSTNGLEKYAIDVRDTPIATFLEGQYRIATEYCGEIAPTDLDEYCRRGGFEALKYCLGLKFNQHKPLTPDEIIDEIRVSGLRGRGGAGFPTAEKWSAVRNAAGNEKTIICNGDEGDPGAFMDRMILESYPFRVLEGMIIASLATGATKGIVYIRAEYPLAIKRVSTAIEICKNSGYLGDHIVGTGHSFHVQIAQGAGAFVCGEETALIASLEGKRGSPRYRPPYPAQTGLWGHPTLVNNTETFALIPWIIRHGGTSFAKLGTEQSKGTKVFSLAGKIVRGGLIEVPMGCTIRHIVEKIGGGVAGGHRLKAVQIGGPSGGCIPDWLCDTPVDFEALQDAGAMMGSGGFVVLDDSDCMVDVTHYFLSFTQRESCGKCVPCRVGTKRMLEIISALCHGKATAGDLEQLEELAFVVKHQSLCGLGKTAPNPVLTSLKYFREEFEAHLHRTCPAKKCKPLIHYHITASCIGCTKCAQVCPAGAIAMKPYEIHEIDTQLCTKCGSCLITCPVNAVEVR